MIKLQAIIFLTSMLACVVSQAADSREFMALSKEATRNKETKEGQRYENQFLKAIDPNLLAAMGSCTKNVPDTADGHPGEILFVVAADGRVKKLVHSKDVPFAKCIAAKLRSISKLPRPPRDSWAIAVLVAKH